VSTVIGPPAADTRDRPVSTLAVAMMIVSSGPQVAPAGPAVSSVAIVTAGPPATGTFFNPAAVGEWRVRDGLGRCMERTLVVDRDVALAL